MFISTALAQQVAATDPSMAAANPMRVLFQFLVIFAVFYLFLIRPQQKKLKEHANMQSGIARGDTIVTNGGLVGKVIRSNNDELLVEIADGVRVTVLRDRILGKRTEASKITQEENDNKAPKTTKKGSEGLKDILTK
ncbi:MAG: preprotein translocase subunit YajC [Alphaproteobacteria bacterium]|nr:preprotein translocase subunit YajC [Alphaproteobacteria bacterium]